jgi:hypothetical protein
MYWTASSRCFFISLAIVTTALLSMQLVTKSTPSAFIREICTERSCTP